jgi:hypothetical protein
MTAAVALRRWSQLPEPERAALRAADRAEQTGEGGMCSLDQKIKRMNRFYNPQGIVLRGEDLRRRRPRCAG